MSIHLHRFMIVRQGNDKGEVIGILKVEQTFDTDKDNQEWATTQVQLLNNHIGSTDWDWFRISQAEYETYRDLHGFEVIELSLGE